MSQVNPYIKAEITQSGIEVEINGSGDCVLKMFTGICRSAAEGFLKNGVPSSVIFAGMKTAFYNAFIETFEAEKNKRENADGGNA